MFQIDSKVVAEFKYRGAEVVIENNFPRFTAKDYRHYQGITNDGAIIGKLLHKYDRSQNENNNPIRKIVRDYRTSLTRQPYYVTVRMGDKCRIISTSKLDISLRQDIKNKWSQIISDCRYLKKRHYKLEATELSLPNIVPTTNLTDRVVVYGNKKVGYVHASAGQILTIQNRKRTARFFLPVKPQTSERHIGIEIECGIRIAKEDLAAKLTGLEGFVTIKNDGSVNVPNSTNIEINVCAPVSQYKQVLKRLTDILNSKEVGAKVNKTCGLHVHLDVRTLGSMTKINDCYAKLVSVQSILYGMQPKSRQQNSYCVRTKTRNIYRGGSRYQGINGQAVYKYNTIEVRLHAGTTEFTKIANWVDLLCGVMYSQAVTPKRSLSSVRSFFRTFTEVPTSLMEYVMERMRKFEDDNAEESEYSQAV